MNCGTGSDAGHQAKQRLIAETGQQLQQLADALAAAQQCCLTTGPVLDVISQKAETANAGLLVLGITSERLLRRSTRPLLVVKQMPRAPYRRALVALDFSQWSAQAIALVRCVAPQARLLLLNAFEVPFEDRLQLAGVDTLTIEHYRQQARGKAREQLDTLALQAGLQLA